MTLWQKDATDLMAAYFDGSATPLEAVELAQTRIEELNPSLNAYTALNDQAMAEAAGATVRWQTGTPKGPLDGVPLIIKDNLVTKGMPAAWGNATLATEIAGEDEAPIARLRAAGAIFLGKGNTPEFAVEGYTDNLTFGPTRNPYDTALTPGGSSGGVVAAVASGLAAAGIGTDGGGSIRRPAGYTGLFGLKPGIGHVGRAGGLPQALLDFEVVGPIARSARDLSLLDAVLSGRSPTRAPRTSLRILAVEALDDAPCDPAIRAAFNETCDGLWNLGHNVTKAPLPLELGPLNEVWSQVAEIGLAAYFADRADVCASANPKYRKMAEAGAARSAPDLYRILDRVFALRNAAAALMGRVDAILMPTAAANPWPAATAFPDLIDGHSVGPRGHAVYTGWVNAAGLPAVSFPGPVQDKMPIGMQIVGPMGSEARLIALAEDCAAPTGWPALASF